MDPGRGDPVVMVPAVTYPRSGSGIQRYAFRRRDSIVATMPSGEEQTQVLGRTAYLTLTWIAADTGTMVTARVDSLVADSGLSGITAMVDSARGARWTGLRPPVGGLSGVTGGPSSRVADQVRDQLTLLFPQLPPDGVRPGTSWRDSTQRPVRVSAFEAVETAGVESTAETPADGSLPIRAVRTRTVTGQATQFGQPITVTA